MKKHELNGKDHKRSYRRTQQRVVLKRRAEMWWEANGGGEYFGVGFEGRTKSSRAKFVDNVMKGKACTFLRWSAKPCSCYMCSELKYERVSKHKWLKNEDYE